MNDSRGVLENCLSFLLEYPENKVLYEKEQSRLFNLFVNPLNSIGVFISKVYKIECKDRVTDPVKQNNWLINNIGYFRDVGNSIKTIRNKLAHNISPMVRDIYECCRYLLLFKQQSSNEELNRVIYEYSRIIRTPFNKRFITVHKPIPGLPIEPHSLGWFRRFYKDYLKGYKFVILTGEYVGHIVLFNTWTPKRGRFIDNNSTIALSLDQTICVHNEGVTIAYDPPGTSFQCIRTALREEILKEINLIILTGNYEGYNATFLCFDNENNVTILIKEIQEVRTISQLTRVAFC